MIKPEWGTKRLCPSCGTRFYDLRRDPIFCPKCTSLFEPEPPAKPRPAKTRRATAPAAVSLAAVSELPAVAKELEVGDVVEAVTVGLEADDAKEDEGDDIIEDASELGEDEDDVAEVIESSHADDDDR